VIKIRENACVLTIYPEKFGNGLLVAHSGNDCPKPFVGRRIRLMERMAINCGLAGGHRGDVATKAN
jgi:hypothetical protein